MEENFDGIYFSVSVLILGRSKLSQTEVFWLGLFFRNLVEFFLCTQKNKNILNVEKLNVRNFSSTA